MIRSNLDAEIVRRPGIPESWSVEAIDSVGDGAVEVALFSGPNAKTRAVDYACARYSEHRLSPLRPLPLVRDLGLAPGEPTP